MGECIGIALMLLCLWGIFSESIRSAFYRECEKCGVGNDRLWKYDTARAGTIVKCLDCQHKKQFTGLDTEKYLDEED